MKKKLPDNLPEAKKTEIAQIVEVIKEFVNPDKIVLYGSYATGKYVEQVYIKEGIRYFYISDYDLIVITDKTEIKEYELANELEKRLKTKPDINFFMYDIKYLNNGLKTGNYFFIPVYKYGVLLYDAGKTKLVKPGPLSKEQIYKNAKSYYDFWVINSQRFYKHAQVELADALKGETRPSLVLWFLFQTIESLYSTLLLVFMGDKPKLHNLNKYRRSVSSLSEELNAIFPDIKDSYERRLFDLLNRAYIGGKYKMDFEVDIEDVQELNIRIAKMIEITKKICMQRIQELE
ncbi:nucleotidyltransferase domain-containing protein [Olivibacter sp. 47]|uniref:nucleotidyltransferase domain-containing protein n=1 Tax=Olivibacter sp. 47 TaxID=3056486 RepID=UPI0025A35069|nr:nucleotidyltransferase domain-containing protein [Olivibacter sp. 47]MDM8174103.1 nucleotidyltransferase domain-containing protein [Olivibacter sp. 47]